MGASCTTTVTPKEWRLRSSPRHYPQWSKHHSSLKNGGGPGTATSQLLTPSHLVNYDTDDEEMMDLSKVPKFARELIVNLQHEEDGIEGEEMDPILLTKIRPGSFRYEFVRENGTKQMFRAESLIDYMLSTRQFQDPETRIEFTDEQLKELDLIGSQLGKPSVYEAKVDGAWIKQKQEDDMDAFNGVEHLCGEYVYKMLRIVEHAKKQSAHEGEASLLMKCFPFYRHYVSMMFFLDKDATTVAIDQYKIFLQGPPNRPTPDRTKKLLKICLDYIDEVSKELWKSANDN